MKLPKNIHALADVLGFFARKTSGYNPDTMQGACVALSSLLERAVNKYGFGKAEFTMYAQGNRVHAWTWVSFGRMNYRTALVDLTFTQFEFDAPHVFVASLSEYPKYIERISGAKFDEMEKYVIGNRAAYAYAAHAGFDVHKLDYILKRVEGLLC